MENDCIRPKWLEWAKEIQFIAQAGMEYSPDPFDRERFERLREMAAEMLAAMTELPLEKVRDLFCNETGFQTPKLDSRAAIIREGKSCWCRSGTACGPCPAAGWMWTRPSLPTW